MYIDYSSKCSSILLPLGRLSQEIVVLGEQHSAEISCSVKQGRIVQSRLTVFLCSQDIAPSQAQTIRNRKRNVHVHVECDAQGIFPAARSFRCNGVSVP